MDQSQVQLLRHMLATTAFRFALVVENASGAFGDFSPGSDTQTPLALVQHMTRVARFGAKMLGGPEAEPAAAETWPEAIDEFYSALKSVDAFIESGQADGAGLEKAFQGPFCDLLHHTGQLSMLRRLAGSPVRRIPFPKASIHAGDIPPDLPDAES